MRLKKVLLKLFILLMIFIIVTLSILVFTKKGEEIADKTALIMINNEAEAFERMGEDGEEFLRLYDKYTELLKTVCNENI